MAKKSISYGPDSQLVQGQRDVAQSKALADTAGGVAFAQSLTGTIIKGIEEQEKRNSIRDAYLADLGGIENINILEQDYNKQAVTSFVRSQRAKYAKLAESYARTKDINLLDKMDKIKYSFSNLNTQLQALVADRKDYLNAYDKGQIVDITELGDSKYTSIYTNKGGFSIEKNGDIGFTVDGEYSKFSDIAGKYNVKSNIGETYTLAQNINAKKIGEKGGAFYREDTKNLYTSKFQETGAEGIMVMAKTDLTGDNEYVIGQDKNGNDIKAGNMSFESMWGKGLLADKFYTKIPKGTNVSWMYDKKNTNTLNDLMSEYYTDVTESSYNQGKSNFEMSRKKQVSNQPYMRESRAKANVINNIAAKGKNITLEDLQSITIDPKLSREIKKLADGRFQIVDSQNQATYIDPNNMSISQIRSILYNLAQVMSVHRTKTKLK